MKYEIDTIGAEENMNGKGFILIPEGIYSVKLIEKSDKTSSKGDPMVSIKYEIIEGEFKGKFLFDLIVIPLQGSPSFGIMGRTMHFLHVIDQPYEGKFATDSDKWLYSVLKVKVKHQLQKTGMYAGQAQAKVIDHDFFNTIDPDIPF